MTDTKEVNSFALINMTETYFASKDVIKLWKKEIRSLAKFIAKESPMLLKQVAEKGWIHMTDTKTSLVLLSSQFLPDLQLLRINGIGNVTIVRKEGMNFSEFHTNEGVWSIFSCDHKLLSQTLGFNLLLPGGRVIFKEVISEILSIRKYEPKSKYQANIIFKFEPLFAIVNNVNKEN